MAEYGVATSLVTPLGTLTFNDFTVADHFRLSSREGADMGAIRAAVDVIPQRDGALVHDAYEGELVEVIEGQIVSPTLAGRLTLEDSLRSKLKSILRADGTLTWTPSGASARQRTVRLSERLLIRGGLIKEFHFALVASDPLSYATTEQSSLTAAFTSTASVAVTNAGTAPSFPRLRLNGPFTSPTLENQTTGQSIVLTGLTLTSAQWVEVNMRSETIVRNDGTSLQQYLAVAPSRFWSLQAGIANTVRFTVVSGGDGTNTKGTVFWRNAYDG